MELHLEYAGINEQEMLDFVPFVQTIDRQIREKSGPGGEYLGWVDYADNIPKALIERLKSSAARIRQDADVLVVAGIGGSYLGAKAVYEALKPVYGQKPEILFTGNSLDADDLSELLAYLEGKSVYLNVISKSGTTLETALAFRFLRDFMKKTYPESFSDRIIATTDERKGALLELAKQEGYETYVIPDDIGGRFSVLTPVGMLPIAVSGLDVELFLEGLKEAALEYSNPDLSVNPSYRYAVARTVFLRRGIPVEVYVQYKPRLMYFNEWLKQLFGESEGKEGKGLFPASVVFTTDLHSLGQYLQDGQRLFFETVFDIEKPATDLTVTAEAGNEDGLNYLAGKQLSEINRKAMQGTMLAHKSGNVPILRLSLPELNEKSLAKAMYFFMKATAMSGYLLGVNPFDQPGVEDYKKNMFALLGKPGTE